MSRRSTPPSRSPIAAMSPKLKSTSSMAATSPWTPPQTKSPHWSKDSSVLHARALRCGERGEAAFERSRRRSCILGSDLRNESHLCLARNSNHNRSIRRGREVDGVWLSSELVSLRQNVSALRSKRSTRAPAGEEGGILHEDGPARAVRSRCNQASFADVRFIVWPGAMMKAIQAALAPSDLPDHLRVVCFLTDGYGK